MVDAMTSVHHANQQLESLVQLIKEVSLKTKVINDIVFKTQLLSFNASIEAARAGQHGRGFAVVAEEVGNLAKMSGQAATEITSILFTTESQVHEIVRNTSERVHVGRQVTEQALKNFKDISHEIDAIGLRISNISEASAEQGTTLTKTASGIQSIHNTAEANNLIAYESNQAASLLKAETFNLQHIARSISRSVLGKVLSEQEMNSKMKIANLFADEILESKQKRAS
jgi:methyl-accepting chemotaxis protein